MFEIILNRVGYLTVKIIPVLVISIIIANLLVEFNITTKLIRFFKPVLNFSNLSPEAGLSAATYLVSFSAGSATLSGFVERKKISEKEAMVAYFVGGLLTFVNHTIIYYIPILLPLLGFAGILYILIRFVINLIISLAAMTYGHFKLPKAVYNYKNNKITEKHKISNLEKIRKGISRSKKILAKIVVRIYLVYTLTSLAIYAGIFDLVSKKMQFITNIINLPGEISAIIAVGLVDPTSSYIVASSFLNEGILNEIETILALLFSSLFTMSAAVFRHSLPSKVAYFGVKLGTKIALYSFLLNFILVLLTIGIILLFK